MDELTIKQKAEAYDKAIEKLRDFYRDYDIVSGLIDVKEELANMFPEIKESKESESERIRKELIAYCQVNMGHTWHDIKQEEYIAWLEKQENKKDNLSVDFVLGCLGIKPAYKDGNAWCILLGNHAEIEDDKVVIKKGEQKHWSKEDEKYFKNVIDELACLRNRNDRKYDYSEMTRLINWFKFLKDRVQPQVYKAINEHYELEEFAKIVRCNLTGISKAVQKLFEAKYLQLTGNEMYGGKI